MPEDLFNVFALKPFKPSNTILVSQETKNKENLTI